MNVSVFRRACNFAAPLAALLVSACAPCEDVGVNVAATCLPDRLGANEELTIEVQEACGTTCAQEPDCAATLDVNAVSFVVQQTECRIDCQPTGVCQKRKTTCKVPQLEAGEYTFVIPGLPSRTVTIEPGAPASCTLP